MFKEIFKNVSLVSPVVHCITNYVTVNDVANAILACGASPIMADDVKEVEEITSICNATYLNIGTLNGRTIESMIKAGKKANSLGHPVVLDPVGAGASKLRTATAFKLLDEIKFSAIRGNVSEIKTLYAGSGQTKGVDADVKDKITEDTLDEAVLLAKKLSKRLDSIIVITGPMDIVANDSKAYIIGNGHPMMSRITGTGCMLTGIIAAFVAANREKEIEAVTAAVTLMGLSGQLGYRKIKENNLGTSSLRTYLIDEISKMDASTLKGGMKVESL